MAYNSIRYSVRLTVKFGGVKSIIDMASGEGGGVLTRSGSRKIL
jgi:hypothetical protein